MKKIFLDNNTEVSYRKPILRQVVCQFRFPTILSINESPPVEFQEKIRGEFPGLEETIEKNFQFELSPQSNSIQKPISSDQSLFNKKNYRFYNKEDNFSINLTDKFIAFSSNSYRVWEDFINYISHTFDVFISLYKPSYFERIGLRFINLVNRKQLEIEGTKLHEVFKPEISSTLNLIIDNEDGLQGYVNDIRYNFDKDQPELFIHVISKLVSDPIDGEKNCLLFDYDIYSVKQIDINAGKETLQNIHQFSWNFFRWCISEKLHNAMKPNE